MSEEPKKKKQKRGKKLELNKETVQELNDSELNDVAGGVAATFRNCRSINVDCPTGPDITQGCPPKPTVVTCGICQTI